MLVLLLPWRMARIRFCHITGRAIAPFFVWVMGCRVELHGREHIDKGSPAIFLSNHASLTDIFIAASHAPLYTVSVAKKQIIYYPFFGLLYALSGHLLIDRSRTEAAAEGMRRLGGLVKRNGLSIFMWPEGTRAGDGRLRPFKRGFVHLALQTGLPVIPFVQQGTHKNWKKGTLKISATDVRVDVLPPIDTSDWSLDRVDEAVEQVHARFRATLPADQLGADRGVA
jgi:1-acyl-sn-glycerol-3-phosphate acyltransferase